MLLLGLAMWTEPAGAQALIVHPLTVRIHATVYKDWSQSDIEKILKAASHLLQHNVDYNGPNSQGYNCNVEFKLRGPVTSFDSAPADIMSPDDLEAVHSVPANDAAPNVPADVKVVRKIGFCDNESGDFYGCAWRPGGAQKTVIVASEPSKSIGGVLWAHEYGHTTGLMHRFQRDNLNLMSPCTPLQAYNRQINQDECTHFRAGSAPPPYPTKEDTCPPGTQ